MAMKFDAKIQSQIARTLRKIHKASDDGVRGYTEDVAQLAKALAKERIRGERTTGRLQSQIFATGSNMSYGIKADPTDDRGKKYAAFFEFSRHDRSGKIIPGKKYMIHGITGMLARWRKGERWIP